MLQLVDFLVEVYKICACPSLIAPCLEKCFGGRTKLIDVNFLSLSASDDFQSPVVDRRNSKKCVVEIKSRCPFSFCPHLASSHVRCTNFNSADILWSQGLLPIVIVVVPCINQAIDRTEQVV